VKRNNYGRASASVDESATIIWKEEDVIGREFSTRYIASFDRPLNYFSGQRVVATRRFAFECSLRTSRDYYQPKIKLPARVSHRERSRETISRETIDFDREMLWCVKRRACIDVIRQNLDSEPRLEFTSVCVRVRMCRLKYRDIFVYFVKSRSNCRKYRKCNQRICSYIYITITVLEGAPFSVSTIEWRRE